MTRADAADDRRLAVVEAAVRLLAEEGPHGLSLRRIAAAAGGSTQLVYTLFGGKPGLADALYAEGFARLAARGHGALQDAPPPGDPGRVLAFGRAYRRFALDEPDFFSVMFGRAIAGFEPSPQTRRTCRAATFNQLIDAVRECLEAGTLTGPSALVVARACWSTVHGLASLETAQLLGAEGDADEQAERLLQAGLDAWRPRGRPGPNGQA